VVSDEALREGVRRFRGDPRLDVRVESRALLSEGLGGSGARFERVRLSVGGEPLVGVLKCIAPDPVCVTRERRFYQELAARLPARIPRAYASGEIPGRVDGWVLLEEFPPGSRWQPRRAHDVAGEIARVHVATLGRVPDWLPRPFSRDLSAALAHVPDGLERLATLQRREPLMRDLATPRAFELARALIRDLAPLARELARSPECVVHRDLHHGNVWLPADGAPILFDWEAVSAGPPIFDLTLLFQYLPIRQIRIPGRANDVGFFRARTLAWSELERTYLGAIGDAPREAIRAAANGAFIWEALYRLGWVASQLDAHVPRRGLRLARIPGLRALGRLGDQPAVCAAWQAMFADFERRAAALIG
jgi:aminoglycoside phosphotransferase (APT) family kinase protein